MPSHLQRLRRMTSAKALAEETCNDDKHANVRRERDRERERWQAMVKRNRHRFRSARQGSERGARLRSHAPTKQQLTLAIPPSRRAGAMCACGQSFRFCVRADPPRSGVRSERRSSDDQAERSQKLSNHRHTHNNRVHRKGLAPLSPATKGPRRDAPSIQQSRGARASPGERGKQGGGRIPSVAGSLDGSLAPSPTTLLTARRLTQSTNSGG